MRRKWAFRFTGKTMKHCYTVTHFYYIFKIYWEECYTVEQGPWSPWKYFIFRESNNNKAMLLRVLCVHRHPLPWFTGLVAALSFYSASIAPSAVPTLCSSLPFLLSFTPLFFLLLLPWSVNAANDWSHYMKALYQVVRTSVVCYCWWLVLLIFVLVFLTHSFFM